MVSEAFSTTPPTWMVQVERVAPFANGARAGAECDGFQMALDVYGARAAHDDSGLRAFSYLWRRFGPPWWGSDDDKDLVNYILGTPHSEVWLSLHLSASPLPYAVGYLIAPSLQTALRAPVVAWDRACKAWWLRTYASAADRQIVASAEATPTQRHDVAARYMDARWTPAIVDEAEAALGRCPREQSSAVVKDAIRAALEELFRPVFVRDVPITILGRIPDEDCRDVVEAVRSPYAGYGIPKAAMDAVIAGEENARD